MSHEMLTSQVKPLDALVSAVRGKDVLPPSPGEYRSASFKFSEIAKPLLNSFSAPFGDEKSRGRDLSEPLLVNIEGTDYSIGLREYFYDDGLSVFRLAATPGDRTESCFIAEVVEGGVVRNALGNNATIREIDEILSLMKFVADKVPERHAARYAKGIEIRAAASPVRSAIIRA